MFCMCIKNGWDVTWESKLCSVCVLKKGELVQGEKVMFCMSIDRGCVGTGERKLCSVSVLKEDVLVQGRLSYVLYVY